MKIWGDRLSKEEIKNVELIISNMSCDPKPSVDHFLSVISVAIDNSRLH